VKARNEILMNKFIGIKLREIVAENLNEMYFFFGKVAFNLWANSENMCFVVCFRWNVFDQRPYLLFGGI
jgi:hypothetical protein